ncbi:hypothetical protein NEMBOFW57_009372 [Staphylotrichum longicolle]|uniref:CHAT domain-containing protein n=1 Tax=Staphylotrichum longicolle TaxID=669026 RepID=A0AAD4HVE2_9PEZI|nr:hypothetical protein NEMBOFW57_009372 [Staphylotrichum longicolle]
MANLAKSSESSEWNVQVNTGSGSSNIQLRDPLAALAELVSDDENDEPAKIIAWYLENHASEPFEKSKAESAKRLISAYGCNLASQIAETGLVPQDGYVQLHVVTAGSGEGENKEGGLSIQHLLWEVLEDPEVWSKTERRPQSVSVVRSLQSVTGVEAGCPPTTVLAEHRDGLDGKRFNILLVVSRPCPEKDVDYQLVANALMSVIDQLPPQLDGQTTLTILRPPTWQAFQDHLQEHPHFYDLVHFDMKGAIPPVAGRPTAVLEFCQPGKQNPLRLRPDYRTGDLVGKELAVAGANTVVLNACDSASFRHASSGSNLAEVLLGHGVQSVVAMAYKVVEESVEIFMGSFYRSLLAHGMTVTDAARTARSELLRNQSRRAHYMLTVQLADYIVPVVYVSSIATDANTVSPEKVPFASVRRTLESIKQAVPSHRLSAKAKTHRPRLLSGRDCDIVKLETLLPVARLVFLHGQGGIGKTELLRYLCRWWKSSGWIDTAVYIDFDDLNSEKTETYRSMSDVVASIAEQLHLPPDERSEKDIIRRLQRGKYLLVFDSADVFEDPITGRGRDAMTEPLKAFIRATAKGQSMVIVASRLDTTSIADIPFPHHNYPLSGLSVINSVSLLQNLSCPSVNELPDTFYRRGNIDSLRRAAIVLEGNPAAIRLVAPELKSVNYDGEKFFSTMFYGVFKGLSAGQGGPSDSRFAKSLNQALCSTSFIDTRKTLIKASQFAPFFNVMPKDLTIYYWFLYLSVSRYFTEGNFEHWISE